MQMALILLGIGLALYPWISNYIYDKSASSKIGVYEQKSKQVSEKEYQRLFREARLYNQQLARAKVVLTDPFTDEMSVKATGLRYDDILKIKGTDIMAYVEIPCIRVNLPIYHGTAGKTLEKGIGHISASSVPVGGHDTHSVLTGHTGLNSSRMFTDLTEMKKGDLFYIHVVGKILAYKVDEINVVLPEDTEKLNILRGEDHVTLITCTPYGVNSHRLLIRGTRTKYNPEDYDAEKNKNRGSQWQKAYKRALLMAFSLILVAIIIYKIIRKIRKK